MPTKNVPWAIDPNNPNNRQAQLQTQGPGTPGWLGYSSQNRPVGSPEVAPPPTWGPGNALFDQARRTGAAGQPSAGLSPSFLSSFNQLDQQRAGYLDALARGGTAGAQAFQQAQSRINEQGASALELARSGTISAPGLEGITAQAVLGPTQQRQQALTQASANLTGDLERAKAAGEAYIGGAQAALPFQQNQYNQAQDTISRGWDRWLQLQQLKMQEEAALAGGGSGGGGGGGGGSSGGGTALTAQGQVTNLIEGIANAQREQDAADRLAAVSQGVAAVDDPELANLQAMAAIGSQTPPAAPDPEALAELSRRRAAAGQLRLQVPAAALAGITTDQNTGVSWANTPTVALPAATSSQPLHGGVADLPYDYGAARDQAYRGPNPLALAAEQEAARQAEVEARRQRLADLNDRQAAIAQSIAQVAGPNYRSTGQIGGSIAAGLNAPIGTNEALGARDLAAAYGYDLGKWGDPGVVAGLFPNPTPYQEAKTANDQLVEQQQTYQLGAQIGEQQALADFYGTDDPAQLSYLQKLDELNAQQAAAERTATNQQREAGRISTQESAADIDAKVEQSVSQWINDVLSGAVNVDSAEGDPKLLYEYLVQQGVPPQRALEEATAARKAVEDAAAYGG